ncbi:MAG: HAD family hydrolase [Candidatus Aenigmarchaeota archaeon]|nr:HAD family hydrolase [Candidatus Aenigmarchaeota archaeon]
MTILFAWDFHGTLETGSRESLYNTLNKVADLYDVSPVTMSWMDERKGHSFHRYLTDLLGYAPDQETVKTAKDIQWPIIMKEVKPMHDSHLVLRSIKDRGDHSIVVSNSSQQGIERFVDTVRLREYFKDIYAAEEHDPDKISDAKSQIILTHFNKNRLYERIIAIGDTMNDVKAGMMAGAMPILLHMGSEMQQRDGYWFVGNLLDVLEIAYSYH